MRPSILLLDCPSKLAEKLKRQGFDVDSGTIGFCTGATHLPCQVYEKDVFIYNPSHFARDGSGRYIEEDHIEDRTPDYSLEHLEDHILRGATFLVFINRIADDLAKQNDGYSWIPFMPYIYFTKDHQPIAVRISEDYDYKFLAPIILQNDLKIPVLQKIKPPRPTPRTHPKDVVVLFFNRNREPLGVFLRRGNGELIILPEFQSNEEIISIFLHRVIPKLYKIETYISLIDKFLSPDEKAIRDGIQELENTIEETHQELERSKEELATATRNKIQTIKNDETAVLILNYYELAVQQEDVALFYLYKVIEALEKKYSGESRAKKMLGCNTEWNLVGKVANASYADIRHAPKPGEKIKEWSQEEIEACFKASEKIIRAYLAALF